MLHDDGSCFRSDPLDYRLGTYPIGVVYIRIDRYGARLYHGIHDAHAGVRAHDDLVSRSYSEEYETVVYGAPGMVQGDDLGVWESQVGFHFALQPSCFTPDAQARQAKREEGER